MNYRNKNFYKDNIFISLDGMIACKKIDYLHLKS